MIKTNFKNFSSSKSNIIFVTGLSASGKSTIAKKLAEKNGLIYIDLDNFECCYIFDNLEEVKEKAGMIFYMYFRNNPRIYKRLKNRCVGHNLLCAYIEDFLNYAIQYAEFDDRKYIFDGVQIYSFLNPSILRKHSFVIIDKGLLTCIYRRIKRSYRQGDVEKFSDLEFFKMISWYFSERKIFKTFCKNIF